jgi:hypothetical protein
MDDVFPALVLILGLLAVVYVMNRVSRLAQRAQAQPPGAPAGTLRLGQFAVQPGASWLVLQPGDM